MIEKIKSLIEYLCKKDRDIAKSLINNRKFTDLKDLVDSSIIIYERNLDKESPREELLSLNRPGLLQLKSVVDDFIFIIDPDYDLLEEEI